MSKVNEALEPEIYGLIEEDPECDNQGNLYQIKPKPKCNPCKECWNMTSGRCNNCGRNIFGDSEYMDWEL